jgi:CarD family transcriptional regulator
MSTRKKAPKKPSNRPAKAIKRSPKSSATSKGKDAKVSAKISKPARSVKKVAAKATKTAKVSSRKSAAAKAKAAHAKSSRVASAAKSSVTAVAKTTKKKSVSAPKLQNAKGASKTNARSPASQSKERVIASAAKKKSENEKKGQERLSATVHAKTVQSKTPSAPPKTPTVGDSRAHANEPPKVINSTAAVIGLEPAATSRPMKAAATEKAAAADSEEAIVQKPAKSGSPRHGFKTNEFIVYPAHGVGQIVALEEQEVAGFRLELFVITFVKDKMTLRVPTGKVAGVGMRKLAEPDVVKKALDILLGRARIKRTMWSRRAQEYETKINSGDLAAISEVVRDLYRSEAQPEQSYSERQLYEAALDRMAREVAVVQKLTESEALKAIDAQLQKGQRRGAKVESDAAAPGAGDSDVEEAA